MRRRQFLALLAVAPAGAALAESTASFPTRPVKVVVPYAPGGLPDTVARVVGQALAERWGQAVVVENKPGGNGVVAAPAILAAPADGYTLLMTDGSMFSVNPHLYAKLPYDPQKDFVPISLTARAPIFIALHPSVPANTFAEFVAVVKAAPGRYSYGSSGIGSTHHLTMEAIKSALGLDIVHVPYKGTGQSIPALVAGDVAVALSSMPSLAGFVKNGRVKLIAVNSSKRSELAPDVVTVAESGLPGFDFAPNIGVFGAAAGFPPALAQKIAKDIAEVLKAPAMVEQLRTLGIDPVGGSPAEYAALLVDDRERYGRAVKLSGIRKE